MPVLDIAALRTAALQHDPFDYVLVPGFVHADALADINRDFPPVPGPGSSPKAIFPPCRMPGAK